MNRIRRYCREVVPARSESGTPTLQPLEARLLLSADIVNGPPDSFFTGFGEPGSPYFAQSFTTTDQGFADELTFQAQPAGSTTTNSFNPSDFHVLITEVDTAASFFKPTTVLFETDTISLPPGDGTQPPTDVVVDLEGLELDANTTYAWIIDARIAFDGSTNQARAGFTNADYTGGAFYFSNFNASNLDAQQNRDVAFSDGTFIQPGSAPDLSFSLTFLSAPIADAGGPYTGTEGVAVTLDASASTDPDDDIVLYEWDTDYDGVTFDADLTTTNATIDVTYDDDFAGTVAVRVTDAEAQSDLATAAITINNAGPLVATGTATVNAQYSDTIPTLTFNASDVDGDPMSATVETSTDGGVTFTAGLPDDGTAAGGLIFNGADGQVGTGTWTIDGTADLAPGAYTFRVTVTDGDGGASQATADLVVDAEDAAATYTGPSSISTESDDAGSFSVELRAAVQDATAFSADAESGDVGTAEVTFRLTPDNGDPAVEVTGTVNPSGSDPLTGFAVADFSGQLGAGNEAAVYTVEVLVGGNYVAVDAAVLTVARPGDGRALGAGSIKEQSAQGGSVGVTDLHGNTSTADVSIADGSKVHFGIHADFKKKNSVLKGRFSAAFRGANGDLWALTTTDLISFTTAENPDGDASTRDYGASLIGTARLINLSTGQYSDPLTLIVDVTDNRGWGNDDTIGFSLWDGDSLVLSSNWDGTQTVQQDLHRGNVRVTT